MRLAGSYPATPQNVARARGLLDRLLTELGLSDDEKAGLRLALSEACANAVLHGSPRGSENRFHVCCEVRGHHLILEVRDQGNGFDCPGAVHPPPANIERGRGLFLIQSHVDAVEFDRQPDGMVVRLVKVLRCISCGSPPY